MPIEAAAEAVTEARLHFVVFADVLAALPRERVLSRLRDVLLQLCCDGGGGSEVACDAGAIACALCICRLVFGAQAADAYSTFLSSCVTAAASKGSLLPLLHCMLQLLPNERLLHLQAHQRIMASSIGGKYRSGSCSHARRAHTLHLTHFYLCAGTTAKNFPSSRAAALRTCSSSAAQTPSSSSATMCSKSLRQASCHWSLGATFIYSGSAGGRAHSSPLC